MVFSVCVFLSTQKINNQRNKIFGADSLLGPTSGEKQTERDHEVLDLSVVSKAGVCITELVLTSVTCSFRFCFTDGRSSCCCLCFAGLVLVVVASASRCLSLGVIAVLLSSVVAKRCVGIMFCFCNGTLAGAISGHQSWAVLCRLLLAEVPKGSDRNAELKLRLQLWEVGEIRVLGQHHSGPLRRRKRITQP